MKRILQLLGMPSYLTSLTLVALRVSGELAKYAFGVRNSEDNCSAIIVVLKNSPPPVPARRKMLSNRTH